MIEMENKLTVQKNNLPANLDDLSKFILIGKEKLVSVKAEIRAMKNLKVAEEVYKQKEVEAKELGGALLLAKVRIGELLKDIPKSKENQYTKKMESDNSVTKQTKQEKAEKLGFSKKDTSRFQQLADNKDIVEQVIENSEDIPTQTECLKKIKDKKVAEKKKEIEKIKSNKPKEINGKYDVIYCDPPWKYQFCESNNREIENHYPTMLLDDMKKMKIPCEENSVLLMWATAPKLEEAIELINSWGFTYKTCAVWDKETIGMGYWFRGQHELLLISVKGKFNVPEPKDRVSSVYREKKTKHSKKPNYYYDLIENMFKNKKYLELFARNKYNEKWEVWGNEI